MLPQVTENAVVGHMWPAGRKLPTPGFYIKVVTSNFLPHRKSYFCADFYLLRKRSSRR